MAANGDTRDTTRFPVGAYAKYKQATEYFLDWLLLARSHGMSDAPTSSSGTVKLKLDAFQSVVDKIAERHQRRSRLDCSVRSQKRSKCVKRRSRFASASRASLHQPLHRS